MNLFIDQARRAWQEIGLFTKGHCLPESRALDYEGKVLVLHPDMLKDGNKSPSRQLVLATGKFDGDSCIPKHRIRGAFLYNGEKCEFDRSDFIGVLNDIHMPWWARGWSPEKLAELSRPDAIPRQELESAEEKQELFGHEQTPGLSM